MREIKAEETSKLYECLEYLGEHHNEVSVYFKGHYPTISSKDLIHEFAEELAEGHSFIAVIEEKEKIIAFCKISINKSEGSLDYLTVLKPYQKQGYGTALMDWALERFQQLDVKGIEVKTVYGNDAIDLYKQYGFREKSIILRKSRNS